MPDHDIILRGIVTAEALAVLLLAFALLGRLWGDRPWSLRLVMVGIVGVLAYVFAGQLKAFNLDIPFDVVSFLGLIAYTTVLIGATWWHLAREHFRGR